MPLPRAADHRQLKHRRTLDVAVLYTGPSLPEEDGELEYLRSRSTSADFDEAGMDDGPRRRRKPVP